MAFPFRSGFRNSSFFDENSKKVQTNCQMLYAACKVTKKLWQIRQAGASYFKNYANFPMTAALLSVGNHHGM